MINSKKNQANANGAVLAQLMKEASKRISSLISKILLNGSVKYEKNALCQEDCLQALAVKRNIKDFDWVEGLKIVDPLV